MHIYLFFYNITLSWRILLFILLLFLSIIRSAGRRILRRVQIRDRHAALLASQTQFKHIFSHLFASNADFAPTFWAPFSPTPFDPELVGCCCGGRFCSTVRVSRGAPDWLDGGGRGRGISPQQRQQRLTMMQSAKLIVNVVDVKWLVRPGGGARIQTSMKEAGKEHREMWSQSGASICSENVRDTYFGLSCYLRWVFCGFILAQQ